MNFSINTEAALADAQEIETIVAQIETDLTTLSNAISATIPSGIDTDWSNDLKSSWDNYFKSDVPTTMEAMKQSATNLKKATDEFTTYSKG